MEFLKSCVQLLKGTPARRDDFISVIESTNFPQFRATKVFCKTYFMFNIVNSEHKANCWLILGDLRKI